MKTHNNNANGQTRYFLSSGKFGDLKAGVLESETRECLGIRELDPPPWLQRMREIGYPPGYLDDVESEEDSPSGIKIYADEEETIMEIYEEGELPERREPVAAEKKKSVAFPGINAAIPENADPKQWGVSSQSSSVERRRRCINSSENASDYEYREEGYHRVHGGNSEYSFSSRYSSNHSPRYSPYDRYPTLPRSPKPSMLPSTPVLERWEPVPYYAQSPDSSSSHGREPRDRDRQREKETFDRHQHRRRW